jgi:hypothetical protein
LRVIINNHRNDYLMIYRNIQQTVKYADVQTYALLTHLLLGCLLTYLVVSIHLSAVESTCLKRSTVQKTTALHRNKNYEKLVGVCIGLLYYLCKLSQIM